MRVALLLAGDLRLRRPRRAARPRRSRSAPAGGSASATLRVEALVTSASSWSASGRSALRSCPSTQSAFSMRWKPVQSCRVDVVLRARRSRGRGRRSSRRPARSARSGMRAAANSAFASATSPALRAAANCVGPVDERRGLLLDVGAVGGDGRGSRRRSSRAAASPVTVSVPRSALVPPGSTSVYVPGLRVSENVPESPDEVLELAEDRGAVEELVLGHLVGAVVRDLERRRPGGSVSFAGSQPASVSLTATSWCATVGRRAAELSESEPQPARTSGAPSATAAEAATSRDLLDVGRPARRAARIWPPPGPQHERRASGRRRGSVAEHLDDRRPRLEAEHAGEQRRADRCRARRARSGRAPGVCRLVEPAGLVRGVQRRSRPGRPRPARARRR